MKEGVKCSIVKKIGFLGRHEDSTEFLVVKKTSSLCRTASMHQIRVESLQSVKFYHLSKGRLLSVVRDVWANL